MDSKELRELQYMFDRIRDLLARNRAYAEQVPGVPGGVAIRTGKIPPSAINFRIVSREAPVNPRGILIYDVRDRHRPAPPDTPWRFPGDSPDTPRQEDP